jgi:glycosyltransferase involved in cell wall biosynthesis
MRIKWYASDLHACGHVRGEVIARAVNRHYAPHCIDLKTNILLSDYYASDVMVFQRQHDAAILEKMRLARQERIKTVYELDDDFFNTPKEFEAPWKFYSQEKVQTVIKQFLKEADAVVVSTPTLGESIKPYTDRPIFVLQNTLDVEFWEREHPDNEAPIIGWMASGSHNIDAPLVEKALHRVMTEYDKVKLFLIGCVDLSNLDSLKEFGPGRVMCMQWQDSSLLPDRMRHMDIGLAPLIHHPYNDSKSGVKVLQYWANSTSVVCSPSPAYDSVVEPDKDVLVAETKEDWYTSIKRLVEDAELRKKLGGVGNSKLKSQYDIRNFAINWVRFFSNLISTPFTE